MNLKNAWNALYEGDLQVLAEELGMITKEDKNGSQEDKGLHQIKGGDDYTGWENTCLEEKIIEKENG